MLEEAKLKQRMRRLTSATGYYFRNGGKKDDYLTCFKYS